MEEKTKMKTRPALFKDTNMKCKKFNYFGLLLLKSLFSYYDNKSQWTNSKISFKYRNVSLQPEHLSEESRHLINAKIKTEHFKCNILF